MLFNFLNYVNGWSSGYLIVIKASLKSFFFQILLKKSKQTPTTITTTTKKKKHTIINDNADLHLVQSSFSSFNSTISGLFFKNWRPKVA